MVLQIIESTKEETSIELMHRGLTTDQANWFLKMARKVLQKRLNNAVNFKNMNELTGTGYKPVQNPLVIDLVHALATQAIDKMGDQFEFKAIACSHYIVAKVVEEMSDRLQVPQANEKQFVALKKEQKKRIESFFTPLFEQVNYLRVYTNDFALATLSTCKTYTCQF